MFLLPSSSFLCTIDWSHVFVSKMKMYLEQRRQAMLRLHLSEQQLYCLLRCDLYQGFEDDYLCDLARRSTYHSSDLFETIIPGTPISGLVTPVYRRSNYCQASPENRRMTFHMHIHIYRCLYNSVRYIYAVPTNAVLYSILCYFESRYNGTWMHIPGYEASM